LPGASPHRCLCRRDLHRTSQGFATSGFTPNFILEPADLRNPASFDSLFAAHRFGTVSIWRPRGAGCQRGRQPVLQQCGRNYSREFSRFHALAQTAMHYGVDRFVYCGSGLEYESGDLPVDESAPLSAPIYTGRRKQPAGFCWIIFAGSKAAADHGPAVHGVRPAESERKLIPYVINGGCVASRFSSAQAPKSAITSMSVT